MATYSDDQSPSDDEPRPIKRVKRNFFDNVSILSTVNEEDDSENQSSSASCTDLLLDSFDDSSIEIPWWTPPTSPVMPFFLSTTPPLPSGEPPYAPVTPSSSPSPLSPRTSSLPPGEPPYAPLTPSSSPRSLSPGTPPFPPGAPSSAPGAPSSAPGAPSSAPGAPSSAPGAPPLSAPETPPLSDDSSSPLPDLIIERVPLRPDDDEPEEFYQELIRRILERYPELSRLRTERNENLPNCNINTSGSTNEQPK